MKTILTDTEYSTPSLIPAVDQVGDLIAHGLEQVFAGTATLIDSC